VSLDPVVAWALRAGLALLLATSAALKLRDVGGFAGAVAGYRLLPISFARAAASVFIVAELLLAAAVLLPGLHAPAALSAAGLLGLYTFAIAWNLARGRRDIDCGCGGPLGRQRISEALLARNALLVIAALTSALPVLPRTLGWLDAWTALAAVTSCALLYLATEALFARPVAS
jgi:uncharacterized membrane protein YphA (DoxX/SURF4 family)